MKITTRFQQARLTRRFALAALLAAGLTMPSAARAQLSTASVNGTVRDTSGSVVPDTKVTLRSVDTGVERTTVTNAAGAYAFLNVLPGAYILEMSKEGFASQRISPFTLEVNQTATFDAALNVSFR